MGNYFCWKKLIGMIMEIIFRIKKKGYDKYDEIVLIRINPDVEDVIKRTNSFWTWERKNKRNFGRNRNTCYEFRDI